MSHEQSMVEHAVTTNAQPVRPYRSYAVFIALYNALFGIFLVLYKRSSRPLEQVQPLDVALLGLATLRLSKAISEDEITAVVRAPVVQSVEGRPQPQGGGVRNALGRLVLCPTCTGTWVAALLTYALHLFPSYTRPFLAVMSASGVSQFSDAVLSLVYSDRDVLRENKESE